MDPQEVIEKARDVMHVQRVFGQPIQHGEVLVVPVAQIRGGAGGGGGKGPKGEGEGQGSGFGVNASPAGVFILQGTEVRWRPALNVNRLVLGSQLVLIAGLWALGRYLAARR